MRSCVAVGEALIEIMRPRRDQPLDEPGEFLGPFASGAPAIFAVAAARLGVPTGLISGVGADAFGRLLRARLETERVDVTGVQTVPGYATAMAFVGYSGSGNREFVFHLRHSASGAFDIRNLPSDYFVGVKWLHLSGSALACGQAVQAVCREVLDHALEAGARLSLDPNLRPELMALDEARERLKPYMEVASVLLPTAEEARALAQVEDDAEAARLLGGTERIVVLKKGAQGCTVFSQRSRLDVPGFAVTEVDPTGAGDCFNAAFLMGLDEGWPLEQVARFANAAGALAVTQQGPMEGAPTKAEVLRFLAQTGRVDP